MITVMVEDYCQNCPGFEADISKDSIYEDSHKTINTTIKCKFRGRCRSMVDYLKKESIRNGLDD